MQPVRSTDQINTPDQSRRSGWTLLAAPHFNIYSLVSTAGSVALCPFPVHHTTTNTNTKQTNRQWRIDISWDLKQVLFFICLIVIQRDCAEMRGVCAE